MSDATRGASLLLSFAEWGRRCDCRDRPCSLLPRRHHRWLVVVSDPLSTAPQDTVGRRGAVGIRRSRAGGPFSRRIVAVVRAAQVVRTPTPAGAHRGWPTP